GGLRAVMPQRVGLVWWAGLLPQHHTVSWGVRALGAGPCRNDPLSGLQRRAEVNLESITRPQTQQPPGGGAALFSCSPGEDAFESDKLEHGIFFYYLIQGLKGKAANKKGEGHLEGVGQDIKDEVKDRLPEDIGPRVRQNPNLVGDLRGSFPLARYDRPVTPDLGGTQITGAKAITNTVGMKLVLIPAGRFTMGSPETEEERDEEERQHPVEIAQPFYLGVYEVTQQEYQEVMGTNPSYFATAGKGKDQGKGENTGRCP